MMDNKAHIWFVYAHPESNSCYYDVSLIVHPSLLDSFLLLLLDICMVVCCFVSFFNQLEASLLTFLPAHAIDQSCLILVSLYNLLDLLQNIFIFASHFVVEIRSIE